MKLFCYFLTILLCTSSFANAIEWKELSAKTFDQAKKENKIILLNLEANWCHWCHVMEDETYANKQVINYLNQHFITVKADQDANPELSNRYKDYGWPATIFINNQGIDIVKRAGFIAPDNFLRLLKAIVKDPSPEEKPIDFTKIINSNKNKNQLISTLESNFINSLDFEKGGFNQSQKYIEYATFEKALIDRKNANINTWILKSIEGAKKLNDPVWGGVYQYSTHGDWKHLHFEKLLKIQARYLHIFLLNYEYNNDKSSLSYAKKILEYTDEFLANKNGLYSNAQDADLIQGKHAADYFKLNNTERRKLGIPKIDTNTFTDNNAAIGSALLRMYHVTQEKKYLNKVETLENALYKRKKTSGLYAHGSEHNNITSLRDQIAMADFLINLVKSDIGNNKAKQELSSLCRLIKNNYLLQNGAFKSFEGNNGLTAQPLKEENIQIARIFNWYGYYSKDKSYVDIAKKTYEFLTSKALTKNYYSEASLLLLANELKGEPTQYVYLNTGKGNQFNHVLQSMLPFYSIIYSGKIHQLPKEKQELFGSFNENVLFSCTSTYCSTPIYSEETLKKELNKNK